MIVNQKFIAQEAGVSQKTVSLFFQGSERIAAKTRERLEAVVRKYNYYPNAAARSIKCNRFRRIVCLAAQYGSHPHLMAYINGAAQELAQARYSLVFEQVFIDQDTYKVDFPELFSERSADGIIGIPGSWMPPEIDERIAALELPTIWLNRIQEMTDVKALCFDEVAGANELAQHLLAGGYRNVGWFGPEFDCDQAIHYSSRIRFETLRDSLEAGGGRIVAPIFSHAGKPLGEGARQLVASDAQQEAVVCYNFQYREAFITSLMAVGINPLARKIIHFASEWEYHRYYDYADCVLMPETELGRRGAQYILSRINGEERPELLLPISGHLHVASGLPKIVTASTTLIQ